MTDNEMATARVTEALIEIHKAQQSIRRAGQLLAPITGCSVEHARVSELSSQLYYLWDEFNSSIDRSKIGISSYFRKLLEEKGAV